MCHFLYCLSKLSFISGLLKSNKLISMNVYVDYHNLSFFLLCSVENLCRDMYLRSNMDDQGFVPVSIIASFNRVSQLSVFLFPLRILILSYILVSWSGTENNNQCTFYFGCIENIKCFGSSGEGFIPSFNQISMFYVIDE